MIYMNFGSIRAFPSGILKKLYFTTSKSTLPILPFHFTTHPTSQFLFLYTTSRNDRPSSIYIYIGPWALSEDP